MSILGRGRDGLYFIGDYVYSPAGGTGYDAYRWSQGGLRLSDSPGRAQKKAIKWEGN